MNYQTEIENFVIKGFENNNISPASASVSLVPIQIEHKNSVRLKRINLMIVL